MDAHKARQTAVTAVPTIDLAAVHRDPVAMTALDRACREHGFFLLVGHGIDAQIQQMWDASAAFFASGSTNKDAVRRSEAQPLGYYDRELTKQQRDLKEVFDFTQPRDGEPNQWPPQPSGFRNDMADFYQAAGNLAERTLTLVYQALGFGLALDGGADAATALQQPSLPGLPEGSLRTSNVRLNCYPLQDPLSDQEQRQTTALGDMALHHHTDPGLVTLLLQDSTGGLQTQLRNGSWIDVPPDAASVVVNLGDALQVLSNDRYRAAVHRVLPMQTAQRFSTPFFLNPQPDATLVPIPELSAEPAHYRAFSWREYIQHRIDDNYADLGAEDTQISHYRIAS